MHTKNILKGNACAQTDGLSWSGNRGLLFTGGANLFSVHSLPGTLDCLCFNDANDDDDDVVVVAFVRFTFKPTTTAFDRQ